MAPLRLTQPSLEAAHRHLPLAMLVVELVRPKRLVQLGADSGDLCCALCQAVTHIGLQSAVYGVGKWTDRDAFARLQRHHDGLYGGFARLVPTDVVEASESFTDGSIDLLVATSAVGSFADVMPLWMRKLSKRGVLLMLGLYDEHESVMEFVRPYPRLELTHAGGAVIALVGNECPTRLEALVQAPPDNLRALRRELASHGELVSARAELIERNARIYALQEEIERLEKLTQLQQLVADQTVTERLIAAEKSVFEHGPLVAELGLELEGTRAELTALRRSRSYRLTKPLRSVGGASGPEVRTATVPTARAGAALTGLMRHIPLPARRAVRRLLVRMHVRGSMRQLPAAPARPPLRHRRPLRDVTSTVSVIIPTLDAGTTFARVLSAIRHQRGLDNVEVLVVDSGSTDGTIDLARSYGALVRQIPPEEFNHGATRDAAAEHASGDVLLMTVQDAVLVGRDALRNLVLDLEDDSAMIGTSPRQIPRSDADLYGAYAVWAHEAARRSWRANGEWKPLRAMSPTERRAAAQLDNVCAAIRRDAWSELRFGTVVFAEDLDFALRAVDRGWSVGACDEAVVIHSHARSAGYHVRRMVLDRLYAASLLDAPLNDIADAGIEVVAAASRELVGQLQAAFAFARGDQRHVDLAVHLARVGGGVRRKLPALDLEGSLAEIAGLCGAKDRADRVTLASLRSQLLEQLESGMPMRYAEAHRSVPMRDANDFIAKLAAANIGEVLGDALRVHPTDSALARRLQQSV